MFNSQDKLNKNLFNSYNKIVKQDLADQLWASRKVFEDFLGKIVLWRQNGPGR